MNQPLDIKIFCIFLVLSVTVSTLQTDNKCLETDGRECNSTDYHMYVACVKRRQKRSIDCDSSCDACNCDSCSYSNCKESCDSCCGSCCSNYIPCDTRTCCRQTCNTQCNSSNCRGSCRKNCEATITIVKEASKNSSVVAKNENKVNITTIINLTNTINNTNYIDIPIQMNNTNIQNITIFDEGFQRNSSSNCCIVISPRLCLPQKESPYIRCFHYRTRQCGDFCTSTIVHKEQRQICQTAYPRNCYPKIIYIPQPQPKCRYESNWPFVSCGIKKSTSCAGCYASEHAKTYMTCPPECYNDAFGNGPYYRHGPFYRSPQLGNIGLGTTGGYGSPYFGYYGFGTGGDYGAFGDPPYGGFVHPAAYNDFRFENLTPEGLDVENYSLEPDLSSPEVNGNSSQFIDVGPHVSNDRTNDYARDTRNVEVNAQNKPRPVHPVLHDLRKKEKYQIKLTQILKKH